MRAVAFAVAVVRFCRALPDTWEGRSIRAQLFRCGTAVGANYQAARRSRSDREFIARLAVVVEEADEACYWLHLLITADIQPVSGGLTHRTRTFHADRSQDQPAGPMAHAVNLRSEAEALLKIFSASLSTARANRKRRRESGTRGS